MTATHPLVPLLQRTRTDADFRRRCLAEPLTLLREAGATLPAGVTVRVLEDTPTTVHLVLPPALPAGEVPDDDLDASGGMLAFYDLNSAYFTRLAQMHHGQSK